MKIALLLLMALVSACASQQMTSSHYLLRADELQESRALNPSSLYRFNSLVVADYIDQPGLVLETSPGEVHMARNHLWAEPLRRSLQSLLSQEVSAELGEDVLFVNDGPALTAIDVRIDQLHGTHDGDAVLVARWAYRGPDNSLKAWHFSRRRALIDDGYAALVAQEKALLQDLAMDIARSLSKPGEDIQ